jgi:hypothetical protein
MCWFRFNVIRFITYLLRNFAKCRFVIPNSKRQELRSEPILSNPKSKIEVEAQNYTKVVFLTRKATSSRSISPVERLGCKLIRIISNRILFVSEKFNMVICIRISG